MKTKIAAYAIAAVLIGFAIMLLPPTLKTGPPSYKPELSPFGQYASTLEGGNDQRSMPDNTYGPASTPYNILPSGLILIAGLVVALTAYATLRKQLK